VSIGAGLGRSARLHARDRRMPNGSVEGLSWATATITDELNQKSYGRSSISKSIDRFNCIYCGLINPTPATKQTHNPFKNPFACPARPHSQSRSNSPARIEVVSWLLPGVGHARALLCLSLLACFALLSRSIRARTPRHAGCPLPD
jgi:hypothetical protein